MPKCSEEGEGEGDSSPDQFARLADNMGALF